MHIFLKEQKYLKDHAAKIQLIFKNPNKNKQNQAFPNQKIHLLDAFPNQKLSFLLHFQTKKRLCFDAYPNQKPCLIDVNYSSSFSYP